MKNMNKRESKKIAVMAAIIMGLMMFAFMPLASATVTYFAVDPDTGYAGTTDSYNMLVDTTGVQTLNITIPQGFIAVAPTAPGQELLTVDFWNTTGALDFYGIGIMTANGTNTVDVSVRFRIGGVEVIGTITENVDYTPGVTNTFESPLKDSHDDTSTVTVKLPTEDEGGYMNITIMCTPFYLESMGVNLKQCVRNPTVAGEYTFTANGEDAKVQIKATGDFGGSVYRDGRWFIRTEDSPLAKVYNFAWGYAIDKPVTGDWSGAADSIGVYRDGKWLLSNSITAPSVDHNFWWGYATDKPVTGDWSGGTDTIGVYRDGRWLLSDSIIAPSVNYDFWWGYDEDIPVTGNWDGIGGDTIGLYRNGRWLLSDSITAPSVDYDFCWGHPTDIPVTGDWDGDGRDSIGLYRNGRWLLCNDITAPSVDHSFWWGYPADIPVTGDWI